MQNHKQKVSSNEQQSKFVLIARTIFTKESVYKMAKVRQLNLERPQENRLMQLPIHASFISCFLVQPLCYTRLATFAGIVEIYNVKYSCILKAGFFDGEEIMRNDYTDQHRFSIPITPVEASFFIPLKTFLLNNRIQLLYHVMIIYHFQFIIMVLIKKNFLYKIHLH